MDNFLKDLQSWKTKRVDPQDSGTLEESKEQKPTEDESSLAHLEEEFMEKVEQRDRLVIEHLKAVNVDPNAPAEEQ